MFGFDVGARISVSISVRSGGQYFGLGRCHEDVTAGYVVMPL